ncbi:MAG: hypothetical protein KDG89_06770 [Geminicoccaceae bacterium]|nr:hypothetical protein [Geminicoccaceae bacterium]
MAVTAQASDFFTVRPRQTTESHGRVRTAYVEHVQAGAGDAGSTIDLWRVPAGRVRIVGYLSRLRTSAFGAGVTLDMGHTGFSSRDGSEIAADGDALLDGKAVGSAGAFALDEDTFLIDGTGGTVIRATVLGGAIPAGATIKATIAYVVD